ncbi:MAG: hypothetical protein M0Z94_17490 [Dehalococcoidales bacterium]|nr:hypothetical protein [Dehalococcoidales bacterium]
MANPGRAYKTRHPKKRAFLEAYAQTGNVSAAARLTGIPRTRFYEWQEHDVLFALEARQAEIASTEALEEEARRRAVEGTSKPVYQGGQLVGHIQEYSDTLLIFLLKGLKPDTYRDRYDVRHSGNVGVADGDLLGDEEREAVRRALTGDTGGS